jgi:hypothetical protein
VRAALLLAIGLRVCGPTHEITTILPEGVEVVLREQPDGSTAILTDPPLAGVRVAVDGVEVGKAPVSVVLAPGRRRIAVTVDGY